MKKNLLIGGVLSMMVALQAFPLLAAEPTEHQGHPTVQTEHDHGKNQPNPEKSAAESHRDQMESKMAKMSVRMEKMKKELAKTEEQMTTMKELLIKAQKTSPGEEQNKLMAEHGAGLRAILAGFRSQMEKMMAQMEQHQMMGKEPKGNKQGMDHGGDKKGHDGGGMMGQEMMEDMKGHHEMMKKKLTLLTDLLGQMEAHLNVISAPR